LRAQLVRRMGKYYRGKHKAGQQVFMERHGVP
jgi:hypothetical protein